MYKYLALGIIAIAGILAIPVTVDSQDDSKLYGYATLVLRDAVGQAVFQQIIHNNIVDGGENYMLSQTFFNGSGNFVNVAFDKIDALCVTTEVGFSASETINATTFNDANPTAGFNCEQTEFTITNIDSVNLATTGVIQFNASGSVVNIISGETITGVGVCSDNGQAAENVQEAFVAGCSTAAGSTNNAPLLAVFDTSDVTLTGTETVDITYTLTLE